MIQKYILKSTFALLVAALTVTSCSESYPSMEYDYSQAAGATSNQDVITKRVPVLLFVNPQNFFTITASSRQTRSGSGPFDVDPIENSENLYNTAIFNIFAFRRGEYVQGPEALQGPTDLSVTAFATNVPAGYNKGHDSIDHANCLLDGTNYWRGMTAMLEKSGTGSLSIVDLVDKTGALGKEDSIVAVPYPENKYFYSTTFEDTPYNFFGYYFDDFKPTAANTTRTLNEIAYENVKIDGRRDLLWGMAPNLTNDLLQTDYAKIFNNLSIDEQRKIHNISGYCTFTAHRGIHPTIQLQHQLSRLKFFLYPGDEDADSIVITKIEVRSHTTGRLICAVRNPDNLEMGREIGFVPNTDDASLERIELEFPKDSVIRDGADEYWGIKTLPWKKEWASLDWQQRDCKQVGKSLMLSPDESYMLYLYYVQKVQIEDPFTGKVTTTLAKKIDVPGVYRLVPQGEQNYVAKRGRYEFRPGYLYNIRIAVYGLQDIQIYVSIAGWEDGGDVPIDPDEDLSIYGE